MATVYICSLGEFQQLDDNFLKDKSIIRIHNVSEKNWYEEKIENGLVLFFDDYREKNISFIDKIKMKYFKSDVPFFTEEQANKVINFIKKNKKNDFIVQCEYGKGKSVAIAKFLENYYKYNIENLQTKKYEDYNTWVYSLLEKNN